MGDIDDKSPWLVGGPARNGKTTLVNTLYDNKCSKIGFPLEGLFLVYLRNNYPFFKLHKKEILLEYLSRSRYTDTKKSVSVTPISYFKTDMEESVNLILNNKSDHQITLIHNALKLFADQMNSDTWVACDLHPEFRYKKLRKYIPGLNMAIMLRDPRESIAASLYWRDYPNRCNKNKLIFFHRLQMWVLSAKMGITYENDNNIKTFNFNKIIRKDKNERKRLLKTFALDPDVSFIEEHETPHFTYKCDRGFYCPDKVWRPLLSEAEIGIIEKITMPYILNYEYEQKMTDYNINENKFIIILLNVSIFVGGKYPYAIKIINDMIVDPISLFRLYYNLTKQTIKNLLKSVFAS